MNCKLGVYLAEKMHRISDELKSHDFRIVFCCHLAFLVLAYIPMPEGKALRSIGVSARLVAQQRPRQARRTTAAVDAEFAAGKRTNLESGLTEAGVGVDILFQSQQPLAA
jgi:hypothetical protein